MNTSIREPLSQAGPVGVCRETDGEGARVPVLTEAEKRQILVEWNQTARDYPCKCLFELIEAQAARLPEHPAVICRTQTLTYGEFNARANQWAHYLRSRGVGPGERVGICLESSTDFAIVVLAVLKSGAACVPLDPNYPEERRAYMLQDVRARVLISEKGMSPEAALNGCELMVPADLSKVLSSQPTTNPGSTATPDDTAYVIYTSGSTGKPRGVLLAHAGLVNYNTNAARFYSITPDDRVLQFCSVSFDIALEELFITWLSGATLILRTDETPLAIPEFLEWIEQQRITVLDLPTAYWHEWVHEFAELNNMVPPELRLVIVGGEKPSSQAYTRWRDAVASRVRWINTYGPTEASICATAFEPAFDPGAPIPDNIPIGRPLPNTRVYVLDHHLNPVAVGVAGELHIAGVGVAKGYFNRPELTAEKFIPDPFAAQPGARLYKTGDLARYLPSGDIEFLGRMDYQIKIRGFRVELGEIETVLSKHPAVREVAVVAREDAQGDKRLVAYFVAKQGWQVLASDLRSHLQAQLPDHMVPSAFVGLQTMPLTPNGKINRRGLPAPELDAARDGFAIPTDALQSQLLPLWQDVLGKKAIGIRDNFFELGGHSLLAARLMHRIGQILGKTLPLAMLFEAPTIEQLAAILSQNGWSRHWSSLVPIQAGGSQPPFFCVHGIGGNVLGFRELAARMSPDYPFYGLQSQGLDGKHPCHTSLEQMAAHYLNEIRSVQPQGPYFLGGFSFGGLVAYEMARQLLAQGEQAALLVLFDTYPGASTANGTSLLRQILQPSLQHWLHDLPKAARKKIRRSIRSLSVPQLLKDVRDSNRVAAACYKLQPYAGRATLVRATEKVRETVDPHAAWTHLVHSLDIVEIASDHYDILVDPAVDQLAEQLKACIAKAQTSYRDDPVRSRAS